MLGVASATGNFKSPLCIIRWARENLGELGGMIEKKVANSFHVVLPHSNPADANAYFFHSDNKLEELRRTFHLAGLYISGSLINVPPNHQPSRYKQISARTLDLHLQLSRPLISVHARARDGEDPLTATALELVNSTSGTIWTLDWASGVEGPTTRFQRMGEILASLRFRILSMALRHYFVYELAKY